jgi:hypothetical protein
MGSPARRVARTTQRANKRALFPRQRRRGVESRSGVGHGCGLTRSLGTGVAAKKSKVIGNAVAPAAASVGVTRRELA